MTFAAGLLSLVLLPGQSKVTRSRSILSHASALGEAEGAERVVGLDLAIVELYCSAVDGLVRAEQRPEPSHDVGVELGGGWVDGIA